MKQTFSSLAGITVVLIAVTLFALEAGDVVTVQTTIGSSSIRETRIWFVQTNSGVVLEAKSPHEPWAMDLARNPSVGLQGSDLDGEYAASIDRKVSGHDDIRAIMREKYGWRDWWLAMLFDTSQSQLIRLEKLP